MMKSIKKRRRKKMSTIDKVLFFCASSIILFTIAMSVIFCIYQSVPDTLIVSFFGVFTGEGCICWRIWAKKKGIEIKNTED